MLLDAEFGPLPHEQIVQQIVEHQPKVLLIGHSGSTSAHPIAMDITRDVKELQPNLTIVYGGVFPTYHFHDILTAEPQIDVIVRGEGEVTVPKLMAAIASGDKLSTVDGIAYRSGLSILEAELTVSAIVAASRR